MSYLVSHMPNWLLVVIMLAGVAMTVYAAKKGKEQNNPHASGIMLILGVGFAVMAVYSAVRGVPSVPEWLNWLPIILFVVILYIFFIYAFVVLYQTKLEPGRKRRGATIAFAVFMSYLLFITALVIKLAIEKNMG